MLRKNDDIKIENFPLSAVEPSEWSELLERARSISPFCSYRWLKLIEEAFPHWRVGVVLALDNSGVIQGGLPYVSSRRLLFHQSHCLPWGTPAGVLVGEDRDPGLAGRLVKYWAGRIAGSWHPYRMALTLPGAMAAGEARRLLRACRVQRQRSLAVPLAGRSFGQWEDSLEAAVRNQNRQAVRRGAVFEQVKSPDEAGELLRLAGLTALRHGRAGPLLSERFYRLVLDPEGPLAGEPNLARVFMVRVNGEPAAFSVCLAHCKKLWLWDYGTDSALFHARPNNLMYRQVIAYAFGGGYEEVDLGAVPARADTLGDFKLGFGGVEYERTSLVEASSVFRIAAGLYSLMGRPGGSRGRGDR
ncbi:MAG: GNAT family N-acetyltransferase [Gemmatimonadota bacterium]|nr:GNAT family N-acetyltransferase [Gemmatimonadota bacterium]